MIYRLKTEEDEIVYLVTKNTWIDADNDDGCARVEEPIALTWTNDEAKLIDDAHQS
jgi:hypothetical protein